MPTAPDPQGHKITTLSLVAGHSDHISDEELDALIRGLRIKQCNWVRAI